MTCSHAQLRMNPKSNLQPELKKKQQPKQKQQPKPKRMRSADPDAVSGSGYGCGQQIRMRSADPDAVSGSGQRSQKRTAVADPSSLIRQIIESAISVSRRRAAASVPCKVR